MPTLDALETPARREARLRAEMVDTKAVVEAFRFTPRHLSRLIKSGRFPKPDDRCNGRRYWFPATLERAAASMT